MDEYHEQANVIEWAKWRESAQPELALLNGSLNGMRLTMGQRVKAKKSGMCKGFPDLALPVPRRGFHGLYIEMKRKNGVPSDVAVEQLWWLDRLGQNGYHAVVCFGFDEAVEVIEWYLNGNKKTL